MGIGDICPYGFDISPMIRSRASPRADTGYAMSEDRLNLSDLKTLTAKDLLAIAEELEIENASTMRKGEMMFSILKERAEDDWVVFGDGVL